MRDDVLDQVRRSLGHAPRAARGTKPPALAAKCHQLVVAAVAAVQAQEAVRQDAALEECIGIRGKRCGGTGLISRQPPNGGVRAASATMPDAKSCARVALIGTPPPR